MMMTRDPDMQQNREELAWFIDRIQAERIASYLEIGSRTGGSLWRIARCMPTGAKVVAVDQPHGDRRTLGPLKEVVSELRALRYDVTLIVGDSHAASVVEQVRALAPFDLCFIDGDHGIAGVTADWNNYGPMARIVAFHDISWKPRLDGKKVRAIEVPQLWEELSKQYRTAQLQLEPRDNGIGILWREFGRDLSAIDIDADYPPTQATSEC